MKVKSEREVTQLCLTLHDPMDCSLPGSSIHGIFQARVLEWGAIAFSEVKDYFKRNENLNYLTETLNFQCFQRQSAMWLQYWSLVSPCLWFYFFKLSRDPNNQKTMFQEMVKVLSFFSQVQEQTAVWELLSSFPNVFQNDSTLSNLFDVLRNANR